MDRRVEGAVDLSIPLRGDVGLAASGVDQVDEGLSVVAGWQKTVDDLGDRVLVRCLPCGRLDLERKAVLFLQGINLGARSSTRIADG